MYANSVPAGPKSYPRHLQARKPAGPKSYAPAGQCRLENQGTCRFRIQACHCICLAFCPNYVHKCDTFQCFSPEGESVPLSVHPFIQAHSIHAC